MEIITILIALIPFILLIQISVTLIDIRNKLNEINDSLSAKDS